MRFRAVVGRVEWKVLHGVEKVRGSRGGRGACDSVFRGFPPYRHCQIISKDEIPEVPNNEILF